MATTPYFRVRIKILKRPFITVTNMVNYMREAYSAYGFDVELTGRDELDLPNLNILDVNSCSQSAPLSGEQLQLFQERDDAEDTDIVAYFVEQTMPPMNGCARHPIGRPGVVVSRMASRWTLAHEIGHVLGLAHVEDPNDTRSLMTGSGTLNIGSSTPRLAADEVAIIRSSNLLLT